MIAALAPAVTHLSAPNCPPTGRNVTICRTFQARRRSFSADALAGAAGGIGVEVEAVGDFGAAVARARDLALGLDGTLLVTGSHYVLAPARAALRLWED